MRVATYDSWFVLDEVLDLPPPDTRTHGYQFMCPVSLIKVDVINTDVFTLPLLPLLGTRRLYQVLIPSCCRLCVRYFKMYDQSNILWNFSYSVHFHCFIVCNWCVDGHLVVDLLVMCRTLSLEWWSPIKGIIHLSCFLIVQMFTGLHCVGSSGWSWHLYR